MVRVHVRTNYPHEWQTFERGCFNLLPEPTDLFGSDSTINQRPAVAPLKTVPQEPEMNVVERKGQGHAQPADSRGDFDQLGGAWQAFSEGVLEFQFVRMHGVC